MLWPIEDIVKIIEATLAVVADKDMGKMSNIVENLIGRYVESRV